MTAKTPTSAQPGAIYPDNNAAETALVQMRWPDGLACPTCRGTKIQHREKGTGRFSCKACMRRWTVRQGTCMEGSRVGLRVWATALAIYSTGVRRIEFGKKLVELTGVTPATAINIEQRISKGPLPDSNAPMPRVPDPPSGTHRQPPKHPATPKEPRVTEIAKRLGRMSIQNLSAAFLGGALVAWAVLSAIQPAADSADQTIRSHYIGIVQIEGTEKQEHVTSIEGRRVSTQLNAGEGLETSLDRHLKQVDIVRQALRAIQSE